MHADSCSTYLHYMLQYCRSSWEALQAALLQYTGPGSS